MQRLNVIYCDELCPRHNIQRPKVIALYSWVSGGALSPPAGPGQSAGGGEVPRSSEKSVSYSTKKRPKTLVWCIFECL